MCDQVGALNSANVVETTESRAYDTDKQFQVYNLIFFACCSPGIATLPCLLYSTAFLSKEGNRMRMY